MLSKGDINSRPGGCGVPELVQMDLASAYVLCPLNHLAGFRGVGQRLGERAEVRRYTGPEVSERT